MHIGGNRIRKSCETRPEAKYGEVARLMFVMSPVHHWAIWNRQSVAIASPDKVDTPHTPQSHPQAGPTTRSKTKIAEEIEQPRLDSVRTTPPAILDYSLLSPITDHGDSCHAMTTLGSSDTLLSPGSISSPVNCEYDTSTDSDAESSDMVYTCTSLRCEYGYCGHTPDSDKKVHDAEYMCWCKKCRYYLCCECIDRGIHVRHRQLCEKRFIEEYDRLAGTPPDWRYCQINSIIIDYREQSVLIEWVVWV